MGGFRASAHWDDRNSMKALETRTLASHVRNLVWEYRDLRKYVYEIRSQNSEELQEPKGYKHLEGLLDSKASEPPRVFVADSITNNTDEYQYLP